MKKKEENKKKEIKFETKQMKNPTVDHDNSTVVSFIVALIVILVLIGGLYFVNAKYVTKDKYQEETTTTTTEVSYDPTIILADYSLSQSEKEYLVLFYDKNSSSGAFYQNLAASYQGETKLYSVDLSNKMNEKYYVKDGAMNYKLPSSLDQLKVANHSLMTVKKGKITALTFDEKDIYSKLSGTKIN